MGDIISKKKDEMIEVYIKLIQGWEFTEPVKMVRSPSSKDAISKWLAQAGAKQIAKKIHPVAEEELRNHNVTLFWNAWNEAFNYCHECFSKVVADLDSRGIKKIQFDVDEYITEEIVKDIQGDMGRHEVKLRENPVNQDTKRIGSYEPRPQSFAKIFSSNQLYEADFKDWAEGK